MKEKKKEKGKSEREKLRGKERAKFGEKSKVILKKIVERRKKLGLTQMDLADLLNLTFSGYFKVETGKVRLDLVRFLEILEKLEITPEEFFKEY